MAMVASMPPTRRPDLRKAGFGQKEPRTQTRHSRPQASNFSAKTHGSRLLFLHAKDVACATQGALNVPQACPVHWAEWTRRCRRSAGYEEMEQLFRALFDRFPAANSYSKGSCNSRKAALDLVATCTQYSADFCLAWSLMGDWTSRILFPAPTNTLATTWTCLLH